MKLVWSCVLVLLFVAGSCRKSGETKSNSFEWSTDSLKTLQTDLPPDTYNDLIFLNALTGFAVSTGGKIVQTTDGGIHWATRTEVSFYLNRLQFTDGQTGYATGGDESGTYLLKTLDGGIHWQTTLLTTPGTGWPGGMFFFGSTRGFITGNGYFRQTKDGGKTWSDVAVPVKNGLGDISFRSDREGYVLGEGGKYYQTTDGGNTWVLRTAVVNFPLKRIVFTPARSYAMADTQLFDLESGVMVSPALLRDGTRKLLFINEKNSVGIGQHYENGFFPYGDISLTNNAWQMSTTRSYSPVSGAIDFTAVAIRTAGKVLVIGRSVVNSTVIELTYKHP